jgi:ATP-dependent helicase/nuclease subunit A
VLQVDGGRYTTAYALVRALRAGGLPAPVRAELDAVRLLTIHGAKGLEAPLVLLLDTDGEAIKAQTMGVLVDWPGEAAYPQRLVFLASESRPPACVADALATEQAARKREELNALYVALTRTQHTLVVSSLQPHIPNAGSWWQRLNEQAQDAPWQALPDALAEQPAFPEPAFTLLSLPNLPPALVEYAQTATKSIADAEPIEAEDSLDSRIGQAMHSLLERYVPCQWAGAGAVGSLRHHVGEPGADQCTGCCPGAAGAGHGPAHPAGRGLLGLGCQPTGLAGQ